MAYAFVQGATPATATGTTGSITYTSNVTLGNLLVFVLIAAASGTPTTISDGGDTVLTPVAWGQCDGYGNSWGAIYCAVVGAGTAGTKATWSATLPAGAGKAMFAYEYSGNAAAGSEVDQGTVWKNLSAAGTAYSSNSLTPANANELAFAVLVGSASITTTWSGGYTARDSVVQGSNFYASTADQVLSGTPVTTASGTTSANSKSGCAECLFVPSGGVVVVQPQQMMMGVGS